MHAVADLLDSAPVLPHASDVTPSDQTSVLPHHAAWRDFATLATDRLAHLRASCEDAILQAHCELKKGRDAAAASLAQLASNQTSLSAVTQPVGGATTALNSES